MTLLGMLQEYNGNKQGTILPPITTTCELNAIARERHNLAMQAKPLPPVTIKYVTASVNRPGVTLAAAVCL